MQCDRVLPEPRPWGDPQPERVPQSLLLWYCASASSGVADIGNPLHPAKAAAKTSAIKTFAMVCIRFPLCWSSDESPRSAPCLCSRGNIVLISRVYRFFVSGNRLGTSVGTWAARLLFEAHACVAAHLAPALDLGAHVSGQVNRCHALDELRHQAARRCLRRKAPSWLATMRNAMSFTPPAGNGTIRRTGRSG